MPRFDASTAQCHVFTEKEGLLSAVAHDLQIAVTRFTVDAEDGAVRGTFSASSLKVLNAMKDGRPTTALGDKDKADIERTIIQDVLDAGRHAQVTFASSSVERNANGVVIQGVLGLHGVSKAITFHAALQGGSYVAEVPIHQPDFGIKPYSAMMGTLKVKPRLHLRVTLPRW